MYLPSARCLLKSIFSMRNMLEPCLDEHEEEGVKVKKQS